MAGGVLARRLGRAARARRLSLRSWNLSAGRLPLRLRSAHSARAGGLPRAAGAATVALARQRRHSGSQKRNRCLLAAAAARAAACTKNAPPLHIMPPCRRASRWHCPPTRVPRWSSLSVAPLAPALAAASWALAAAAARPTRPSACSSDPARGGACLQTSPYLLAQCCATMLESTSAMQRRSGGLQSMTRQAVATPCW